MIVLLFLLMSIVLLCGRYKITNDVYVNKVSRIAFNTFAIFVLFFVTCFRYNVGYDYHTYYNYVIAEKSWGAEFFEFVPRMILLLARYFNAPLMFFAVINGAILILVIKEIYDESIVPFESLVFFITMFYFGSLSTVRQWLGIAIIFYGFRYVVQRKFIKYLLCVIVATLCHTSAIISIVIYFVYNFFSVPFALFCMCVGFLLGPKVMNILFRIPVFVVYEHYIDSGFTAGGNKIQYIYYLLFFFSLIIYFLSKNRAKFGRLISIIAVGIVCSRVFGATMGGRMALYFYVFFILLIPYLFEELKPSYLRKFYLIPFYLYYVLFLYTDSIHNKGYTNYILYFFKGDK